MSRIVEDVKRYLWLHPAVVDSTVDPVELLRGLLAEHEKTIESKKRPKASQ